MSTSLAWQILRDTKGEKFQQHMAVNQACLDAGIKKLPQETAEYFGYEYPEGFDEMERQVLEITEKQLPPGTVTELESGYRYEIDLTKLPPDAKLLRFFLC